MITFSLHWSIHTEIPEDERGGNYQRGRKHQRGEEYIYYNSL